MPAKKVKAPLELPTRLAPVPLDRDDPPDDLWLWTHEQMLEPEESREVLEYLRRNGPGCERAWRAAKRMSQEYERITTAEPGAWIEDATFLLKMAGAWRSYHEYDRAVRSIHDAHTETKRVEAEEHFRHLVNSTWSLEELRDLAASFGASLLRSQPDGVGAPSPEEIGSFSADLQKIVTKLGRLSTKAARVLPFGNVDADLDRISREHLGPIIRDLERLAAGGQRGRGRPRHEDEDSFMLLWHSENIRRTGKPQPEVGMLLFNAFFRGRKVRDGSPNRDERPLTHVNSYEKRVRELIGPTSKKPAPRTKNTRGR